MNRSSRRSRVKGRPHLILFMIIIILSAIIIDRSNLAQVRTTHFAKTSNSVTIWLNGDDVGAIPGWNNSSPGPTLVLDSGVTVHLLLNATDGLLHDWFIDTRSNFSPDPNGITSPDFSHSTTNVLNFTFTPIIGQNVPSTGNWTYRCMYHPTIMFGTVKIIQLPDFSLLAPPTISTIAGSPVIATITVNAIASFSGTINLTATAPTGLNAILGQARIITPGSSTLTVSSVAAGNYTVLITGTNGTINHAVTIIVSVTDFTFSTSSITASVNVNASTSSTVIVTSVNHFGNPISWSVNATECSITPAQTTPPISPDLSCTFSRPGIFRITITGTSGTLSHSSTLTFDVTGSIQPAAGGATPWLFIALAILIASIAAVTVSYSILRTRRRLPAP